MTAPRWTMGYGDEFDMPGAVAFFRDGVEVEVDDVLDTLNAGEAVDSTAVDLLAGDQP